MSLYINTNELISSILWQNSSWEVLYQKVVTFQPNIQWISCITMLEVDSDEWYRLPWVSSYYHNSTGASYICTFTLKCWMPNSNTNYFITQVLLHLFIIFKIICFSTQVLLHAFIIFEIIFYQNSNTFTCIYDI